MDDLCEASLARRPAVWRVPFTPGRHGAWAPIDSSLALLRARVGDPALLGS